ncbi:hypothetical protein JB92DRAFT_2838794 [Gautieria morchelliformis]|nr:hypothetical protein JB92DRAFT_2838794 [Gautieria morchelliformis]
MVHSSFGLEAKMQQRSYSTFGLRWKSNLFSWSIVEAAVPHFPSIDPCSCPPSWRVWNYAVETTQNNALNTTGTAGLMLSRRRNWRLDHKRKSMDVVARYRMMMSNINSAWSLWTHCTLGAPLQHNITLDARSRADILVPIDDTDNADEAELQQLLIQLRVITQMSQLTSRAYVRTRVRLPLHSLSLAVVHYGCHSMQDKSTCRLRIWKHFPQDWLSTSRSYEAHAGVPAVTDSGDCPPRPTPIRVPGIEPLRARSLLFTDFGEGSLLVPNFEQVFVQLIGLLTPTIVWYCPVILVHGDRLPLHLNGFLTATEGVFLWDYISSHNRLRLIGFLAPTVVRYCRVILSVSFHMTDGALDEQGDDPKDGREILFRAKWVCLRWVPTGQPSSWFIVIANVDDARKGFTAKMMKRQ